MAKFTLDDRNNKILIMVGQQNNLTQIWTELQRDGKVSIVTVSKRLKTLELHGFIEALQRTATQPYILTKAGEDYVAKLNLTMSRGETETLNSDQSTRGHALEVQYSPYKTNYAQTEAVLSTLGISFKTKPKLKPKQYDIEWEGLTITITTNLYRVFGPQVEKPIQIDGDVIKDEGLKRNLEATERFLAKTHFTCKRDIKENLLYRVRYIELAFTNNPIAERVAKEGKGYITLAWDRKTGHSTIWTDHSFTFELETDDIDVHKVMRPYMQGIKDGAINPYEDEARTRRDIEGLKEISGNLVEVASKIVEKDKKIDEKLDYIAENYHSHVQVVVEAKEAFQMFKEELRALRAERALKRKGQLKL